MNPAPFRPLVVLRRVVQCNRLIVVGTARQDVPHEHRSLPYHTVPNNEWGKRRALLRERQVPLRDFEGGAA